MIRLQTSRSDNVRRAGRSTGAFASLAAISGCGGLNVDIPDLGDNTDQASGGRSNTPVVATTSPIGNGMNVVNATPDYGIDSINLSEAFRDPDGGELAYSATVVDGGRFADSGLRLEDGVITGTPASTGTMTIRVTATDTSGVSATRTFTVVTAPNQAPTASDSPLGDVRVVVGERITPFDLDRAFTDPEGGRLTYSASLEGDSSLSETGLGFTDGDVIAGAPSRAGDLEITVTAVDQGNLRASQTFTITVVEDVNHAPVALADAPDTVDAGRIPIDLNDWFSDEDGTELTYTAIVGGMTLTEAGTGLEIEDNLITGEFTGSPNTEVVVIAIDGDGGAATHGFTLVYGHAVVPAEPAMELPGTPVVTFGSDADPVSVGEGTSAIDLNFWFTESSAGEVAYAAVVDGESLAAAGIGLSIEDGEITGNFTGAPGTEVVVYAVNDAGVSDTRTFIFDETAVDLPRSGVLGGDEADNLDLVHRGEAVTAVHAGAGDDAVSTGAGAQMISGGTGDDRIEGAAAMTRSPAAPVTTCSSATPKRNRARTMAGATPRSTWARWPTMESPWSFASLI